MGEIKLGYPYIIKSTGELCVAAEEDAYGNVTVATYDYNTVLVHESDLELYILNKGDEVCIRPKEELKEYKVGDRQISLSHDSFTRNGNKKAFIKHAAPGYFGNLCYTLDIDEEQWLWSPLFIKFQKREPKIEYDNKLLNKVYKSLGK